MSTLVRITRNVGGAIGDLIAGRPGYVQSPSPLVGGGGDGGISPAMNQYQQWFASVRVPGKRVEELTYYDYLEREIPDVAKALDAYATMAVTGNLAGGGRASFTIRPVGDGYPPELLERFRRMEVMIQRIAYTTVRTMVKYGSYMPEIVPDRMEDGNLGVRYIRPIPPGTIFRWLDKDGGTDPAKYWIQIIDGKPVGPDGQVQPAQNADANAAPIPQWKLPHFAVWTNVVTATNTLLYGTSILKPFGAIGLKVHGVLDSAVLARLTRAAMRYVWQIDVSDIKDDQSAITRRLGAWMRKLSRSQTLMNSSGQADSYKRPPTPDADFYVPAADGLSWGLDKMDGDMNLARVGDVEMLIRFYFGALGVPPEYIGHERSQGGRSNLSQIDIHFARSVRHIQLFASSGFEHIIWVDMLLGGYDPREYPIQCVAPPIGARDDLLQAQIRALQASVVSALKAAGMRLDVNPKWILQTFLTLDEELEMLEPGQVEKLFEALEIQPSADPPPGGKRQNEAFIRGLHESLWPGFRDELLAMVDDPSVNYGASLPDIEQLKRDVAYLKECL